MAGVPMDKAGKAFTQALSDTFADAWLVLGDMAGLFVRDKADEMLQGAPALTSGLSAPNMVGKYAVDAFHNIWVMEYWGRAKDPNFK